jgi:CrcB protein
VSIIEVFIGGGLGAVCRFLLSKSINQLKLPTAFPYGTFIVNMIGCFAIGFLFQAISREAVPKRFQLLLVTGFLGGFTTFSSFSLESANLLASKNFSAAAANMFLSVVPGIVLVFLGMLASAKIRP